MKIIAAVSIGLLMAIMAQSMAFANISQGSWCQSIYCFEPKQKS